jgi:hypothetical protein
MPKPELPKIKFNPNGGTIKAEIKFETLLVCTYTLDLREAGSNVSVDGYPKQGDNTNPEDDTYSLPLPTSANKNRTIWINFVLLDQTGNGGSYKVDFGMIQDGSKIWDWTSGKKQITGNFQVEISAAQLIGEGE